MTNDGKAVENANPSIADHDGPLGEQEVATQPNGLFAAIGYAQKLFEAEIIDKEVSPEALSEDAPYSVEGGGDGLRHRIHP